MSFRTLVIEPMKEGYRQTAPEVGPVERIRSRKEAVIRAAVKKVMNSKTMTTAMDEMTSSVMGSFFGSSEEE